MPGEAAPRRAWWASSTLQQPRAPLRRVCRSGDRARCTPVTSWPASTASAAATAESTPPLIAAISLTSAGSCPAGALDHGRDDVEDGVDVGVGGGVPQAEPQRAARPRGVGAGGQQYVAGPGHPGAARGAGGALDAAGVEQHEQRV